MASESVENYLKAIYKLELPDLFVPTRAIAERLGVARPSVSRMVKRLAARDLLTHHRYNGVRLTDFGRRTALRIIRNHRILETYLVDALGMPWVCVDDEVERLEHVVSDELVNRMEAALGFPRYDPHGSPIPDRNGEMPAPDGSIPLNELDIGRSGRVSRVVEAPPEVLSCLEQRGLIPGVEFSLVDREAPDSLHVLVVGDKTVHLGKELAERLRVLPFQDAS